MQKIKQNLIVKAKLKKNYAKIKERELSGNPDTFKSVYHDKDESEQGVEPHKMELHPERQAMLDRPEVASEQEQRTTSEGRSRRRRSNKRQKAKPFKKEEKLAQQHQAEAEARKKEMDERNRQRQLKLEERERFRKVMGKARTGGKNGQRKLGMESKVLLEKVKKIMGE